MKKCPVITLKIIERHYTGILLPERDNDPTPIPRIRIKKNQSKDNNTRILFFD